MGMILAFETTGHTKSFMRESSMVVRDSYLGWVQNLKKVMIYSDTKGTGKKDNNLCFLQCFFYGKEQAKKSSAQHSEK